MHKKLTMLNRQDNQEDSPDKITTLPKIPDNELNNVAKDAYKEALKEVYKEKIKAEQEVPDIPREGRIEGIKKQKKDTTKKQEVVKKKLKI